MKRLTAWLLMVLALTVILPRTTNAQAPAGVPQGSVTPTYCNTGQVFWNTVTSPASGILTCVAPNVYTALSGSSSASSPAPIMGFYLGNACTTANLGQCFNSPANTQQAVDCSWTSASAVVNCATSHFVAADVGKRAFGYQNCGAFINLTLNNNNNPITTAAIRTIQAVNSGTQVTLSGTAGQTVATNIGCFIWGNPDDAGAALMDTAMQAAAFCPKGFFQSANYMFTDPHFFTVPAVCANNPPCFFQGLSGCSNAGNMLYSASYELEGRGSGTTYLWLPPGFPENNLCNNGKSASACWVVTTQGRWSNIHITGGGNYSAPNMVLSHILLELDGPATLDNYTCTNFGGRGTANGLTRHIGAFLWIQLHQVNISGCGTEAIATNISSVVTAEKVSIDNPVVWGWHLGALTDYYTQSPFQFDKYNLICYDCRVFGGAGFTGDAGAGAVGMLLNNGLRVKLYHSTFSPYLNTTSTANTYAYRCEVTAGCVLDAEDVFMDMTMNGTASTTLLRGIWCVVNCTNNLTNVILKGSVTSGATYTDTAGSFLNDKGGNVYGANSVISGAVLGATNSATGTTCATGNFALTSGWGTSSVASVAANGNILGCHVTVTGAAGTAGPVLTWTYPAVPFVAPGSCHLSGQSGTLTGVSTGTPGTTNVAFTFTGTPSAQTYTFDVGCP